MRTIVLSIMVILSSMVWSLSSPFQLETVPVFSAETVTGEMISYKALLHGGVVTFFRSSCGYCLLEYPMWAEVRQQYPDLKMLLITHNEAADKVAAFLQQHGNPFNHVINDSNGVLWRLFGASQTPETFVFNQSGFVTGHFGYIGKRPESLLNNLRKSHF